MNYHTSIKEKINSILTEIENHALEIIYIPHKCRIWTQQLPD